jgi:flagellar biosynthesis protein FlhA
VVTLEAGLEQMIVSGMHDPATGQPVIEPDLARGIGERISAIISDRGPGAAPIALIVQPRARRPLAALLRLRAPQCLVLSISELPPSQPIEVISVIGGEAPQQESAAMPIPEGIAA